MTDDGGDSGDDADDEFESRPPIEEMSEEELEEWHDNAIDATDGDWMQVEEGADAYGHLADMTPEEIRDSYFGDVEDTIEELRAVPGTKVREVLGPPDDDEEDGDD